MTKQETYQVLAILQAFYPDAFRGCTEAAAQMKISLWQEAFEDEAGALVIAGAKAYASTDTKGFMPTPGQIKEQIRIMHNQPHLSEQDAWDLVLKALRNSTYGYAQEYAKLPDIVKKAIGSQNMLRQWAGLTSGDMQYTASEFKRAYREIVSREQNVEKIPTTVKQIAAGSQTKLLEG